MTGRTMQPHAPVTKGYRAAGPPIAGISAAELAVMQAAAARFTERHAARLPGAAAVTSGLRALAEPASAQAAGLVSARRDLYTRHHGTHFMEMPHHAH